MTVTPPRAWARESHDKRVHMYPTRVRLPLIGDVTAPPPGQMAYFAGLGILAAVEIIEWPLALVIGTGHLLSHQPWSRILGGLGGAAEEA